MTPFFTAVYIVEWLILQTIYVINKEIHQFLGLKSAVYNQERFRIRSGLKWRAYGTFIAVLEILTSFVSGLSCVYCGFKFTELGSNSNFDMGGFELTTDVGSYLKLSQTWMVFLIISGITLLIILLLLCFMFTRIKIAIELI